MPRIYTERSGRPWGALKLCIVRRYSLREGDLVSTRLRIIGLLYILRIVMLLLFAATSGGGIHWRGTRAATPAAESRCLSYCQYPGDSLPQSTGRGSYKRSLGRPRPPMVVNQLTHPTLLVVRAPNRNQFITNKNKVKYGVASTMWLLRSTHLRKKQGEGGMEKPQQ